MKKILLFALFITISISAFAVFPSKGWRGYYTAQNDIAGCQIYKGQDVSIAYTTEGEFQVSTGGPIGIRIYGEQFGTAGGWTNGYSWKSFKLNPFNNQATVLISDDYKYIQIAVSGNRYVFVKQ